MTGRRPIIAGNWKMYKGPAEATAFFDAFLDLWNPRSDRTVLFFPPSLSFASAKLSVNERPDVSLGVQNAHWEEAGAFTGELSMKMVADAGAEFVLVGHSERRHVFGETSEETANKVRAALDVGIVPVLCVGETLDERRAGRAEAVVDAQLRAVLSQITAEEARRVVVAYEPVWAIGTGETASPADAGAMHQEVRGNLRAKFGDDVAAAVPILYGGSVKPDNAADIMREEEVDGVLVGGASLDPTGFAAICGAAG